MNGEYLVQELTLNQLKINQNGLILSVGGKGNLRQHLLDMGIIPGINVKMIRLAPLGDPLEIRIHDYELTLRLADAERIKIKPLWLFAMLTRIILN